MISAFRGRYDFLSNFYPGGRRTVEHHFQAAKCVNPEEAARILGAATPGEAKKLGRRVNLRPDWEAVKLVIMKELVRQKFTESHELTQKLLDTGDHELYEGNWWGDRFWGVDSRGEGENHLGKILMEVRAELKAGK